MESKLFQERRFGYNDSTYMQLVPSGAAQPQAERTGNIASLLEDCVQNTRDTTAWSKFLGRFTPKLKFFIRGTLRQSGAQAETEQEKDLLQSTIVRLVENDCAVLRRFSGNSEEELNAYLAVVTRSVVRDALRRQRAQKRPQLAWSADTASIEQERAASSDDPERTVLARELATFGRDAIRELSRETSDRDSLIFQLYFFHGLSIAEIAGCRGIDLSETGIKKVLTRVKDRVRSRAGVVPGASS